MDLRIAGIEGRAVLDSRGSPTIAVDVTLADGTTGDAMVPRFVTRRLGGA
jgi:enolase